MMVDYKTTYREKEIDIIFKNIPQKYYNNGLELGSGAHIQTKPLFKYCKSLVSTEYESRLKKSKFNKTNDNNFIFLY